MSNQEIKVPSEVIRKFCQKWKISEFAIFGSLLREDFSDKSDIDVLVTFLPEANFGLFDMVHMENELKEIFGREVDLIQKKSIERSKNYIRRKNILDSYRVVYAT